VQKKEEWDVKYTFTEKQNSQFALDVIIGIDYDDVIFENWCRKNNKIPPKYASNPSLWNAELESLEPEPESIKNELPADVFSLVKQVLDVIKDQNELMRQHSTDDLEILKENLNKQDLERYSLASATAKDMKGQQDIYRDQLLQHQETQKVQLEFIKEMKTTMQDTAVGFKHLVTMIAQDRQEKRDQRRAERIPIPFVPLQSIQINSSPPASELMDIQHTLNQLQQQLQLLQQKQ